MAVDHIRYDLLTQEALRSVLRRVLADAAKNGLPGDHHFYISYATNAPGVRMSPRLQAQYPEEITIVLQHQFPMLLTTLLLMVVTGYLYVQIPKGFFPQQDTGFIFGEVDNREDASFRSTALRAQEAACS